LLFVGAIVRIRLKDYPVDVVIGHYKCERQAKTRIILTFNLLLHTIRDGSYEKLEATLDYEMFLRKISKYVSSEMGVVYLLESFVNKLGKYLINEFSKIKHVTISAEKIAVQACDWGRGVSVAVEESFGLKKS
jgi:dihydroneopterin aldolase